MSVVKMILAGILTGLGLIFALLGGLSLDAELNGVHTTAVVTHCTTTTSYTNHHRRYHTRCDGSWSLDGHARSGTIQGSSGLHTGDRVAVSVLDGTAYQRHSVGFGIGFVAGGGVALVVAVVLWAKVIIGFVRRRRRPTPAFVPYAATVPSP